MRLTFIAALIVLLISPASVIAESKAAQPQPAVKQAVNELENGVTYEVISSGS